MNDIERMLAVEAIKQTKARYFRFLDTKDFEGFADVFAADAIMDNSGVVHGSRKIAEFVLNSVVGVTTVHHGHTPEIEILSPTTARGIWAMEDKLWKIENSSSVLPFNTMHGYGHYHETYSLIDGRWLIQTTTMKRLRVDFT